MLAAIEAFSVLENLNDLGVTEINPRNLAIFQTVMSSIRKARRRKDERVEEDNA